MPGTDPIDLVIAELRRAEAKHPGWPEDLMQGVAIVAEEALEVVQAAAETAYRGGGLEALRIETAQLAAMAIRFLMHLGGRTEQSGE